MAQRIEAVGKDLLTREDKFRKIADMILLRQLG
jgi:hypothetical protein